MILFDKTPNPDPANPNSNFIFGYHSTDPYLLVVNRFLVFISNKNFDIVGTPKICEGAVDSMLDYVAKSKNVIFKIDNKKIERINRNCGFEQLDIFYETIETQFKDYFLMNIGRTPEKDEVNKYMSKALKHIGEHYKFMESEGTLGELLEQEIKLYK